MHSLELNNIYDRSLLDYLRSLPRLSNFQYERKKIQLVFMTEGLKSLAVSLSYSTNQIFFV